MSRTPWNNICVRPLLPEADRFKTESRPPDIVNCKWGHFRVNGIAVAEIIISGIYRQDFMALNEYDRALREKDFVIEPAKI